MESAFNPPKARPLAFWLFACCLMIFVMALIGAITRLTQSGLSITDWAPIKGTIPPLTESDWQKAFESYQQIPQYKLLNRGMTLLEFKEIFFWEWVHRFWGRLIGLVFALGLLYFGLTRRISKKLGIQLSGIFFLGGLQGYIGWFMVESGLSGRTSVSATRLLLHFADATLLYALILWLALGFLKLGRGSAAKTPRSLKGHGFIVLFLLALTMSFGTLTAGLHAGEAYNTWPKMEGEWFPSAALTLLPKWVNIFENLACVQFIHRWLGPFTALLIIWWGGRLRHSSVLPFSRNAAFLLIGAAFLQVALGLATLLSHAEIILAVLHQAGAFSLLSLILLNLKIVSPQNRANIED